MTNGKSAKKDDDLKKYQDPINLSPKNLELGLWIATNQKKIYKILVIILASIAAGFLLYSGYGYFYYFVFGKEQDLSLEQSLSVLGINGYRLQNPPIDISYSQAQSVASNNGTDFIVHLKNSNEKQSATFNYCFKNTEGEACGNSFILPKEEKNILLINSNLKSVSRGVSFEVKDIYWKKLKAGDVPNWDVYQKERLNFNITTPKISNYGTNLNYLEFSITNNSAYSYFEVPLNIVISNGADIRAINRYIVKNLDSYETKNISLSWPEAINAGGIITITPEINILDSSVYKPYKTN